MIVNNKVTIANVIAEYWFPNSVNPTPQICLRNTDDQYESVCFDASDIDQITQAIKALIEASS